MHSCRVVLGGKSSASGEAFWTHLEEKVQNALQSSSGGIFCNFTHHDVYSWTGLSNDIDFRLKLSSGGNFANFIHKEFSDINPYYTILTINVLVDKIVKFPSTSALKGILNFFFHV